MTAINSHPNHVLIIPDGNRRCAKENNLRLEDAYKRGAGKITDMIKWILHEYDTTQLTIHGLSYENIANRDIKEIEPIVNVITSEFEKWVDYEPIHESEIRVNIYGENEHLPRRFQEAKENIRRVTQGYRRKELNILVGYSGRREIMHMLKKIRYSSDMDDSELLKYLWVKTPIDIVIRTSNTYRLSNCPLYQINYAELAFIEKYFPEITREDIEKVMVDYSLRERRYGR